MMTISGQTEVTRDVSGMVVGDYLLLYILFNSFHSAKRAQLCMSPSIFSLLKGLQTVGECGGLLATTEGTAGVDLRLLLRLSGVGRASSIKEERHLSSREVSSKHCLESIFWFHNLRLDR